MDFFFYKLQYQHANEKLHYMYLFQKAIASGKLDVRKINFCNEHFNRFSYYLNTSPGFWSPRIIGELRNGDLHPLEASATQDSQ